MPHRLPAALILFWVLALAAHAAPQCEINGKVSRVVDGDTLRLAESPQGAKQSSADTPSPERRH